MAKALVQSLVFASISLLASAPAWSSSFASTEDSVFEEPNISSIADAEAFFKGQQEKINQIKSQLAKQRAAAANQPITYTHSVSVELIPFTEGLWTSSQIAHEKSEAQKIYNQCHVRLDFKDIPDSKDSAVIYFDLDGYDDAGDEMPPESGLRIGRNHGSAKALKVFFMDSFDPEYAAISATSIPDIRVKHKDQEPIVHSVWMSHQVAKGESLAMQMATQTPEYNVLAHEMGHVLLNADHVSDPRVVNLMHERRENLSDNLTDQQCETIRNSPLSSKFTKANPELQ